MRAATSTLVQYDVVIVGACVTGSAVATHARDAGLTVALVDARSRVELGRPRRPTPVPVWALEESRLPVGEVMKVPARIHLVAGDARATMATPDCVMLEPGALALSLLDRAVASGAALYESSRVVGLAPDGNGVALADGTTIAGRFVVDASGVDGAALLGERAIEPGDIASIAHETRRIGERRLADAYLEATGVERGESVVFLAPCGPGSLVVARVDEDARTLSFDAVTFAVDAADRGNRGDHRAPTARAAIRRVARGFSWLGDSLAQAEHARHVSLGGLRARLATGNVALVGGAAGLARPGLGGEVALGIVSAGMLVEAVAKHGDLARYERRVRARWSKLDDLDATVARSLCMLDEDDVAAMIDTGAIGPVLVAAVLEQRTARLAALRFTAAAALRSGRAAIVGALDPRPALEALQSLTSLRTSKMLGGTSGGPGGGRG